MERLLVDETTPVQDVSNSWVNYSCSGIEPRKPRHFCPPKITRYTVIIREMGGLPDIVVVIDSIKESIAIQEANKLGIPVVAVIDSNSDPDGIEYPIPGNDDALRSIKLYCDLMATAVLAGVKQSVMESGKDVGEEESPDGEPILQADDGAEAEAEAEAEVEQIAEFEVEAEKGTEAEVEKIAEPKTEVEVEAETKVEEGAKDD